MKKLILLFTLLATTPALAGYTEALGYFDNQQYPQAFAEFKPLADMGLERAQYYVGYMYLNGYGVDRDEQQGLKYLQKSVNEGFEKAEALMGYFLSEGIYMPQNKEKGIELYQKAAQKGDDDALLNLGVAYYFGDGIEQDIDKAIEYLSQVNIVSKPVAARYLADMYASRGDKEEIKKALDLYQKAAVNGDLISFHSYAVMQHQGKAGAPNLEEAITYYTYAASQNYAPSQYVLGSMYVNGEGVKADLMKGYAWISFAVNQNLKLAIDAQKKLEENMTLSDLDKARREMTKIQNEIIGQVESPLKDAAFRGDSVVVTTKDGGSMKTGSRRARVRRRR